jgi:hypothetical protein
MNESVGAVVVIMMPAGSNSLLAYRALWQSYQQRHLERVGGMDEEIRISRIQYL